MNPGGEARRALVATALGAALGLIAAVFARKSRRTDAPKEGHRWRARSAT
ncbi:MAG: hypothetical protein ACXVQY_00110 [Actinomycetota bacterium]